MEDKYKKAIEKLDSKKVDVKSLLKSIDEKNNLLNKIVKK